MRSFGDIFCSSINGDANLKVVCAVPHFSIVHVENGLSKRKTSFVSLLSLLHFVLLLQMWIQSTTWFI